MRKATRTTVVTWVSLLFVLAGCAEVPITGRRQLSLVPESLVTSMSIQEYQTFLSQSKVSGDAKQSEMVTRVGTRIVQAVNQYCEKNCDSDPFEGYKWEFNLIEDKQINAFAMPGGKVVVYTGILPVTKDETGLAAVVGHEIAHVFARHGSERMSQGLLVQMGGMGLDLALQNRPEQTRSLFNAAYGLGSQVGILLPYSRKHETEADHLGLIFMAMAGYDPQQAVGFWQRMSEASKGQAKPPEFLSTHPADATRIRNLQNLIPEAMAYYKPGGTQTPPAASSAAAPAFPPIRK